MKKGILISFLGCLGIFANQANAFEYTAGDSFVFADLLVWKLQEGSDENWGQEIPPEGAIRDIVVLDVPFKWDTGFRVGLGHQSVNNCWDATLYYTHFKTSASRQATVNNGGIYSAFLGNFYANNNTGGLNFGPNYLNASIQWQLDFNTLDLEFGRSIEIDSALILRPFVGFKAAKINHHINSQWANPTNFTNFNQATETLKNDFWGVGPVLGLNSLWPLLASPNYAIKLVADFSGSLMWGHWTFSDVYENNIPTIIHINNRDINGAATMLKGLLGIEWSSCITGAEIHIRLGYEAQVWFNQLQYYNYNMGKLNNLMSLQGGVLDFNINF